MVCLAGGLTLVVGAPVRASALDHLDRYSLEDLLALEATSVAKKRQSVADAAAAVFVITQEDIRRSGARTVPDLLRMVPGVEVGSIDGNSTAISMRGFNTRFANSVLVLVNGRSIYVSAVSGVLWDQLLDPLDTIERIEVVRGPGATIWGANAVNGIINIITKNSAQLSGGTAQGRIGTDGAQTSLSYGDGNSRLSYRLTAAGRQTLMPAALPHGGAATVETRGLQLGGQLDLAPDDDNALTARAAGSLGDFGPRHPARALTNGAYQEVNLLGRWSRRIDDDTDSTLQAYINHVSRHESGISVDETLIDAEGNLRRNYGVHEVGLGFNYRFTGNRLKSETPTLGFIRGRSRGRLVSGYVQDDYWLVPDRLRLTAGTKVEYNSLSGLAVQPSVRMLWRPAERTSVWSSWSRAVRTTSSFERNATFMTQAGPTGARFYAPIPVTVFAAGQDSLKSEKLDAYEAGARFSPANWLSIDLAVYHNRYRRLIGFAPVSASILYAYPLPSVEAQYRILNNSRANSSGVEMSATATLSPTVRVDLYGSLIDTHARVDKVIEAPSIAGLPPGVGYTLPLFTQPGLTTTPKQQGGVRFRWDVSRTVELDAWLRHVGTLKLVGVPAYTTLDLRLAWAASEMVSLELTGRNLFQNKRLDFREPLISAAPALVERRFALAAHVRF